MTKKHIYLLLVLLISNFFYAQKKTPVIPDYETIKKETADSQSKYYYPNLLKRFIQNDTLLTNDEYRHLYYGYTYQPSYKPYKRGSYEENMRKYYKNIEPNEYDEYINLANQALKENPFDLRVLNFLGYVYHLKGDDITAKKVSKSFKGIINAITSSGDGLKCETGFHVISVADEYVLLNFFGFVSKSQGVIESCDYFRFEKGKYDLEGIYFNIEQMQAKTLGILGKD